MARKRTKYDARQLELPLSREAKLALIRSAMRPEPIGATSWAGVVRLLEQVHYCSQRDGCFAYVETLAAKLHVSKRTVRRYRASSEAAGVLKASPRIDRGSHRSNEWSIDWDRLRQLSGGAVKLSGGAVKLSAPIKGTVFHQCLPSVSSEKPPPPAPTPPRGSDWVVVVEMLFNLGLVDAAPIAIAREAGVTAEEVERIALHYQAHPGAWQPGAIHFRLRSARPGQDPASGWPPPAAAYVRVQERAAREKHDAARQAKWTEEQVQADVDAAHLEELERRHGAALDALDREAFDRFAREVLDEAHKRLYRVDRKKGRRSPLVRRPLLEAMEAREEGRGKREEDARSLPSPVIAHNCLPKGKA